MKKILVPTDFSECAGFAAQAAAQIAKKTNAEIYFLHAIEIPHYESSTSISESTDIPEALFIMKLVKKKFEQLLSSDYLQGIKCYEAVIFENTYETIAKQAEKNNIDLIVMGTRGASGLQEIFVGSVTQKVVRHSKVPVLTISKAPGNLLGSNVVYTSTFLRESGAEYLRSKPVIDLFKKPLHLLKIITPASFETTSFTKENIMKFVDKNNITDYTINIINEESSEEGILNFANEVNASLIVMNTHARKGLSLLFSGSVTEQVVNSSGIPVLSVHLEN
jgi:nucleotide-binding universal stress UspA family protein